MCEYPQPELSLPSHSVPSTSSLTLNFSTPFIFFVQFKKKSKAISPASPRQAIHLRFLQNTPKGGGDGPDLVGQLDY